MLKKDLALVELWEEEGKELFKQIKDMNLDVYLNDCKDWDNIMSKAVDVPTMSNHFYIPVMPAEWNLNYPSQINVTFPIYGAVIVPDYPIQMLSFAHTYTKFIEILMINILCPTLIYFLVPEDQVTEEARGRWKMLSDQYRTFTSFGFGIEGFAD